MKINPTRARAENLRLVTRENKSTQITAATAAAFLKLARMNGYLSLGLERSSVELLYTAERRRRCDPCLVLKQDDRWYSLSAHVFGDVLTDAARNEIFQMLLVASLPGSLVRVSNRVITATRLPFRVGEDLARWLAGFMLNSNHRERGRAREHARCEGYKQPDGTIKLRQAGITRKAA